MRFFSMLFSTLFLLSSLNAQKKQLSVDDFANWNRLENKQISNHGHFVAYEINRQKGDGKLIVYNVKTKTNDTISYGYDARFAPNDRFIAFKIKASEDTLHKYKLAKVKKEKMPKDSLGVLNLSTKAITKFAKLNSFALADENGEWLALLMDAKKTQVDSTQAARKKDSAPKALKKEDKKTKVLDKDKDKELFDLVLLNPIENKKHTFCRVEAFTMARKGHVVAFVSKLSDSTNINGVVVFNTLTQKADTIFRDSVSTKRLTLDEAGTKIAFLASADTAKIKTFALFYSALNKPSVSKIVDTLTVSIPKKWAPSENGGVYFSPDGTKLFFGTAPKPKPQAKDTVLEEDISKLDLWSYTDLEIQPQQLKNLEQEKKRTFLALYRIDEKKCLQLADSLVRDIKLINRNNGDVALGINDQPYLKRNVWSSRNLNDYYLIDLKTGLRKSILKTKNNLSISPAGKYAVWFDFADSAYYSVDLKTFKTVSLTKLLPVSFCDEVNDMPNDPDAYGLAGWTENDQSLLLYDRFDCWKIDPTGKQKPQNLTQGRAQKKRYRYVSLNNEEVFIPRNEPVFFSTFNENNNREGYCSIVISKSESMQNLLEGDFMLGSTLKAKHSNLTLWATQTVKDYPEIKISDLSFANACTLSVTNPQQANFNWATVEFVKWNSFAGDSLKGLLYKPENFDPTRKYPMLVYFYERNSETSNRYNMPQPSRSTINIPYYASNEYLIFVPDIVYKTGYPGQSAYNAIVSGVYHLMATCPFVNEKKMGLQGQSWGGYQTAYLVTQTDLFVAGMAGAPVSNMTSAYGGIRWGTGMSRMFQYEETQSRIGGTLWDKPMRYIENSPLFMAPRVHTPLLIMSNDNDGAVPWYQGIEFFMALYRLQKPVWLLNYNGMEHNLEAKYWANRIDLSKRLSSFFNHYLKDEPAPEWMLKGIPAVDKGKKFGF